MHCKICDIRDLRTAITCAGLGVTHVGLHCIDGINSSRQSELSRITLELPARHPAVETVLVTRVPSFAAVAEMVLELGTTCVQLHADTWSASTIAQLREIVLARANRNITIVGVAVPSQPESRYQELCSAVDMVIVDQTFWGEPRGSDPLPPAAYAPAVKWIRRAGKVALIAGGLTPENVAAYVKASNPHGVDLQRGVRSADGKEIDVNRVRYLLDELGRCTRQ